jgi:NAD(P)-dependent dehydrogenase (short-subunit alcohol dehydrogenase family)
MPAPTTYQPHAGRVALVTGAARGIGQAIAVGFAERGARVVVGDLGDLDETSQLFTHTGSSVLADKLDISDPASVDALRGRVADELGRLDILVNNAAIFEAANWDDLDFELWQRIMSVNLKRPHAHGEGLPAAHARPRLGTRHQPRLGDSCDRQPGLDRLPLKQDGRDRLHPRPVSDAGRRRNHDQRRTPVADQDGNDRRPAGRSRRRKPRPASHPSRGRARADIADSVFLLASDEAGWITGQTLMANGGNAFGL